MSSSSPSVIAPVIPAVEGSHELVQQENERLEVSSFGPHHPVTVGLFVPRLMLAADGADVGIFLDAVVVLGQQHM